MDHKHQKKLLNNCRKTSSTTSLEFKPPDQDHKGSRESVSMKSRSSSKSSLLGKGDADSYHGSDSESNGKHKGFGSFEKRKTVAELFKRQHEDFSPRQQGTVSPRANSEGDLLGYESKPQRKGLFHRNTGGKHNNPDRPSTPTKSFFNRFDLILSKRSSHHGSNGTNSPRGDEEEDSHHISFKNHQLEEVLCSKDLLPYFETFLKSEHSEENLEFWQSIQEFKEAASMDKANEIYDMFLKSGAEKEVNINFEIKKTIARNLPFPTYRVFEDAEESIFKLMKTDSFQRFKSKPVLAHRSRFRFLNHDS